MPAIAIAGAGSAPVLSAASLPITTSWRLPLEPSMMVTVLLSAVGACCADFAACSLWPAPAGSFSSAAGVRSAIRATGSPPNGLSVKSATVRNATRTRPSSTASAWIAVNGSRNRRFWRSVFCPSGVLSSSAASVIDLPESTTPTIPRWAGFERLRRMQKAAFPALREASDRQQKRKGDPRAALFTVIYRLRSVRGLVGRLFDRRLVAGCGYRGRGRLDAVQQVGRGLQRLVVLGVRRHVGLRAGLFVAVGFQMAAQRGLALGVGARLQFVRHVLQHLDVGHDALGLDRLARRGEVARGGEPQRAVAAAERDDGLHRTLAERAGAHQRGPLVILQRAGDDFGGRGRAAIDQHDDRLALGKVARMGGAALGFLSVAAAGRNDLAALQEGVGDGDRFLQQAAGIVSEIDDVALQLVAELVREGADLALQAFGGLLVEGGDADIGDVVLFDA